MSESDISVDHIEALAAEHGLVLRGCMASGSSRSAGDMSGDTSGALPAGLLLLFGQAGSSIWREFSGSAEYRDGRADPLDRWSRRIARSMADELGARALFPFEGPPWYPFGRWAQQAEHLRPSPLGILMHPQLGLWHAYRFALIWAFPAQEPDVGELFGSLQQRTAERLEHSRPLVTTGAEVPSSVRSPEQNRKPVRRGPDIHACDDCIGQPCLSACPVTAFGDGQLNVRRCLDYLDRPERETGNCLEQGCQARAACPQAKALCYEPDHVRFHMREFHASLKG